MGLQSTLASEPPFTRCMLCSAPLPLDRLDSLRQALVSLVRFLTEASVACEALHLVWSLRWFRLFPLAWIVLHSLVLGTPSFSRESCPVPLFLGTPIPCRSLQKTSLHLFRGPPGGQVFCSFGMRWSGILATCPIHSNLRLAILVSTVFWSPYRSLIRVEVMCCSRCWFLVIPSMVRCSSGERQ